MSFINKIAISLLIVAWFLLGVVGGVARAQEGGVAPGETTATNPKDRDLSVTASVTARGGPPPYPILVSPAQNAILTSGVVTFVWQEVTGHTAALDRYELNLNGTKKFGDISLTAETTADYVLTISDGKYYLALKADKYLIDGLYTWHIRVVDVNGLGSDSTTRTFTVDSTPPPLLVTGIDGQAVTISAADPNSISSEPITVQHSQPLLIGKTDAGAEVQLTVTYPDGSTASYKVTADINGVFGFTLESLTANQVISLKFIAIDLAGLSTVLDGVRLQYQPRVIVIPIPPIIPGLPPEIIIPVPSLPSLPIVPPVISRIFPTPFPPVTEPIVTPLPQPVKIVSLPIFAATPWLWLVAGGLFGYTLSLFWLTGNAWSWLPFFLGELMHFWFWPWWHRHHELRSQEEGRCLPWTGFTLVGLDEQRRTRVHRVLTDWAGCWSVPLTTWVMYQVVQQSAGFEYPADRINLSEVRIDSTERQIYLAGESIWLFDPKQRQQASTVEYVALPVSLSYRLVIWVRRWRPGRRRLWLYLPRLFLGIALAASAWVLGHVPLAWSAILLVLILWLVGRDLTARLPSRLAVYGT